MEERKGNKHTDAVRRLGQKSNKDRRGWRIAIFTETRKIAAAGSYQNRLGVTVTLPRGPTDRSQQVQSAEEVAEPTQLFDDCRVVVYEGDCVDAARHYCDAGFSVAVLNMASDRKPGGGVQNGSGAQEENLFRRSNYFQHLYNRDVAHYPIALRGGIYTPNVTFFRESEADEYRLMDQFILLNMVAVPAMRHPRLTHKGADIWIADVDLENLRAKMRTMLKLAASYGHNALILSAWGCGAFCNPPLCVATVFRQMLDGEFHGRFRRVVFAIFDDHNAKKEHNPEGNLQPFARAFDTQTVQTLEELT